SSAARTSPRSRKNRFPQRSKAPGKPTGAKRPRADFVFWRMTSRLLTHGEKLSAVSVSEASGALMNWIAVSSVVTAIAIVVQVCVLIALLLELRKTTEKVNALTSDLRTRIGPILTRVQILLDDTQPKIASLVSDAAHVVYLARRQAQKMDRVFTEA